MSLTSRTCVTLYLRTFEGTEVEYTCTRTCTFWTSCRVQQVAEDSEVSNNALIHILYLHMRHMRPPHDPFVQPTVPFVVDTSEDEEDVKIAFASYLIQRYSIILKKILLVTTVK